LQRRSFLLSSSFVGALLAAARKEALAQSVSARTESRSKLTLNVRDFGAKGDGSTKDTAAIQRAIDRASSLGGGDVLVPAGRYLSGALALRSNTTLRLDSADAVILGSPDFDDYPITEVRWEGKWIPGRAGLIYALDAQHIGIVGNGQILGNSALGGRPSAQNPLRHPSLIEPLGCSDVRLEGFSTQYRSMWSIHPTNCENVAIRNLTIRSTGGNGDGIDIDSCRSVLIDSCDISSGDDCIAIKSGRGSEAYVLGRATEDVHITNCTLRDSIFACIGIGSETSGGIRDVRIERCRFEQAQTFAIYIKTRPGRGAFIEDISADDLDVSGTVGGFLRVNALNSGLQDEAPVAGEEGIPSLKNFRFSRVRVKNCPVLADVSAIHPAKPLDGFSLTGVTGDCAKGISLVNVHNAEIQDVRVSGLSGPLLSIYNTTGKGLEGATTMPAPRPPDPLPVATVPYKLR